jgi:hypothetical protein
MLIIIFSSRQGQHVSVYSTASRPALEPTQPSIKWVPGALSPGVKRSGRETDDSTPSSADGNGIISPLPHTSSR